MSMSSAQQVVQHVVIAFLAVGAVLLVSGCDYEDIKQISGGGDFPGNAVVIRCNPDTKTLQTYGVCTNRPGDSPMENKVEGALDGHPCSESKELQGIPFSIEHGQNSRLLKGAANVKSSGTEGSSSQTAPAQASSTTSQVNLFSTLMPLLFGPSFSPSSTPLPAACDPTNQGFIVNHRQNSVTAFGICPLRLLKEIPVASNPLQVALTPDGSQALVTSYDGGATGDGALIFIDASTYAATSLDLPNYFPSGIAISPDGTRAYLTHYFDIQPLLLVIDIPNRKLLTTIPLRRQYPGVVVLTPDGTQAWVNYYNDTAITIVDLQTNTIASTLSFNLLVSRGMAFNPQGTKAFVAVQPDQLYVIDTATLATIATITVGNGPNDVIMLPEGDLVAVGAEYAPGTWWVNGRTNQLAAHSTPAGVTTGGTMGMAIIR